MNSGPCDTLLYWLSARGQVGDLKLREACKRLQSEPEQARRLYYGAGRSMVALGHLEKNEMPLTNHRWLTLPPYGIQLSNGEILLMGARLPQWRQLLEADSNVGFHMQPQPEDTGPQRWSVKCIPTWLETHLSWRAPERGLDLLASLPSLDQAVRSFPKATATSVTMQHYDFKRREWRTCRDMTHAGLYCKKDQAFGVWFLVQEDFVVEARRREQKSILFWWQKTRRRNFRLAYSQAAAELTLSSGPYPLPLLLDRALRSASGLCPLYDSGHWIYSQIDLPRAQRVSDILEARLERQ